MNAGLLVALCAGCPTRNVSNLAPHEEKEQVKEIPLTGIRDIDILFVIDNSGSMSEEQTSLASAFPRFMNVLDSIEGGRPNVHIGVVSSNTGIGGYMTTGCLGNGDDGRLQNSPRGACTPPSGYFISYEKQEDGTEVRNYTEPLSDVFTCIARLGTTGCGLEQHLEAMKRALDGHNPQNAQFLRDEAYLAVIFVADEDDCSAQDSTVFDPSQTAVTDPLGPFGSFRCFEFGVQCDGAPVSRSPADYDECEPRGDSYLYHPDHYVEFLKGLKDDDRNIIVAGIIGNEAPVAVGVDMMGKPELLPSCVTGNGEAAPGVRLRYFLDQFPDRNTFTSICNENLESSLEVIARLLKVVIGSPCLDGEVDLTDISGADGIQLDCQVSDVRNYQQDNEISEVIPRCAMNADNTPNLGGSDIPCWWVEENIAACPDTLTNYLLHIERMGGEPPPNTTVVARCVGEGT
jgi:hypothetical protein